MPDSNRGSRIAAGLEDGARTTAKVFAKYAILAIGSLLAAAILAVVLAIPYYQKQNRAEGGSESRNYAKQSEWYDLCRDVDSPVLLLDCIADEAKAENNRNYDSSDLQAQQDMALFAFILVVVSVFGVAISVIGIAVIYDTLRETRRMTLATREIGERQSKAYLSAIGAKLAFKDLPIVQSMKDYRRPVIVLKVHNSGNTPAVNVSHFCEPYVGTSSDISRFKPIETARAEIFTGNVPANGSDSFDLFAYGLLKAIEDFGEKGNACDEDTKIGDYPLIFVPGVIFYEDVFGNTYRSHFCFLLNNPTDAGSLEPIQTVVPQFERIESREAYIEKPE